MTTNERTDPKEMLAKAVGQAAEGAVLRFFGLFKQAMRDSAKAASAEKRTAAPKPATPRRHANGGASDGRRLPAETKRDAERFAREVGKHPGKGIRFLGAGMQTTTAALGSPVAYALKHKLVCKLGERSATRYFPAKKR